MANENSLIPKKDNNTEITQSIDSFSRPLSKYLEHLGLPVDNILSPTAERRKVIVGIPDIIELIPQAERGQSHYLSKFSVAVAAGLFDGALNYLWNETVLALHKIVIKFDIDYFFTVAESINARYKGLRGEDDLKVIESHDLLEICRRIGITNEAIHKRLNTVNYFRNHASAAHPNENELSGIELLSYLEHCIKYAIRGEFEHSAIQIKVLFENIRKNTLPQSDCTVIASDLKKQPTERISDFSLSLLGLYCDQRQEQFVRGNVEFLMPELWPAIDENTKFRIGGKFGYFRKHGDTFRKDSVNKLLTLVNGLAYKDEESLAEELIEKLQELKTAHFSWNNFYNEYPHSVMIKDSLPKQGIPAAAKKDFVKVISICFAGNGKGFKEGVDERAVEYYAEFLKRFEDNEIAIFLKLFKDIEFMSDLDKALPQKRMQELASTLNGKTKDVMLQKGLNMIITSKNLTKVGSLTEYEKLLDKI